MSEPILMTMQQVSARLGVSIDTLRTWRKVGTGPPSARIGRVVRYRTGDVAAWVDAHFDDAPVADDKIGA